MTNSNGKATVIGEAPSNDAAVDIDATAPYIARVLIEGTSAILFHRWSVEAVAEKAASAKGSAAKKTDNIESYVWRCDDGTIGIPGEYLRMAMVNAGRYRQDPRSPRKSAMDLFKAAIIPLTEVAPIISVRDLVGQAAVRLAEVRSGEVWSSTAASTWDYLDQRHVTVQRAGITRVRPAFLSGWRAEFDLLINSPEYLDPTTLVDVLNTAGKFVGLADFRPTYGRFHVVHFEVVTD